MSNKNFVEYNNFTYNSIFEFLESVKDIGVYFYQVKLDINFIVLNKIEFDIYCDEILALRNISTFNKTKIEINLKFTTYISFEKQPIWIRLNADKLNIYNQIISFNLYLFI